MNRSMGRYAWICGSGNRTGVGVAVTAVEIGGASCCAGMRDAACCHAGAFIAVARFDCVGEGDHKTRGNTCSVGGRGCSGVCVAGGDIESVGNTIKGVRSACARGA